MASPKPECSSSAVSEDQCMVQVSNSNEPVETSATSETRTPFAFCDPRVTAGSSGTDGPIGTADPIGMAGPSSTSPGSLSSDEEEDITNFKRKKTYYTTEEMRSLWSWKRVYKRLGTAEQCLKFAEEQGLIRTSKMCTHHKKPMSLNGVGLGQFRCRKSRCRSRSYSRATGTWFEQTRLPLPAIFQLMFGYCDKQTYHQIQREIADDDVPAISTTTIADWYKYCRETIVVYELYHQDAEAKIGGPGKIVQIYESKIGERLFNRGHYIEGHWAIGVIDQNNDMRFEVLPDNERTVEVMVPIIQKHVEVGSIIHTTSSPTAYPTLTDYGYLIPDGTMAQRIESQWRGLNKVFTQKTKRGNFTDWLIEYSWRRKISRRHGDPFEELIKAIKYLYPCT